MTAEQDDHAIEGRQAVRAHFVGRLRDAGIQKPKGMTAGAFDQMLDRQVDWLAYMHRENLITLAEQVLDNAGGPKRDMCPTELVIRDLARRLQERPVQKNRIMTSWLASIEGPSAQMAGHLVELFRFLRVNGRPPGAFDKIKISEAARDNSRTLALIRERMAIGQASIEERQFAEAYAADQRVANDIVRTGAERRDAKLEGTRG
ncbi:hypothetical protein [Falsirhodobacter halotolerans]|uniref:hypothetical protein n=1 Tax=Falsirhodobacter halotolerans TaxID=1146892 RepID=UPI001FD51102|nr:hypothetical protein [Falsirhodobacter halotolerans]MCJ8138419.1 hypothetical protein [Falsirhodobacter halotolerans]